jgi:hypothetical protein
MDILGSIKGSKAKVLGSRRFILDVELFFAPALDGVGKLHIKVFGFWPDEDANTTYVVGDVLRVVAAEVKKCVSTGPSEGGCPGSFRRG